MVEHLFAALYALGIDNLVRRDQRDGDAGGGRLGAKVFTVPFLAAGVR